VFVDRATWSAGAKPACRRTSKPRWCSTGSSVARATAPHSTQGHRLNGGSQPQQPLGAQLSESGQL